MTARVAADASGRWLAVIGASGALLVDGATDRADELLAALAAGDPVQPVLDLLVGSGIGDVPDFALVLTDADGRPRHAVVRGVPVVRIPGLEELTGHGVRTWREHEATGTAAVLLAPGAGEGPSLPIGIGAVLGGRIELVAEEAPVAPARPVPPATEAIGTGPGATAAASTPPPAIAPSPTPLPEHTMVEPEEGAFGYDRLFESTIVRSVEDAAVRPIVEEDEGDAPPPASSALIAAAPTPVDPEEDGDHDGETVLSGSISGRAERSRPEAHEVAVPAAVRRFALVLPGERREPIVGELVIGRAPTARVVDGRTPRLVALEGDPDVSRSHVRIALEGDTVVVTDLRSRNGTNIVLPGKPPQLLRADEPTPVIPGTIVDLGATQLLIEEDAASASGGAGA
jgi:hypothetical protein